MVVRITKRHVLGQGLVEYSIILALVAVVSVPALQWLCTSLKNNTAGTVSQYTPSAAVSASGTGGGLNVTAPPGKTENSIVTSPDSLTIRLADGSTVQLDVPVDIAKSIATVGANGTTELMADSLEAMAKQLLAEGKIDKTGSDAILKLANQAHRQAAIASLVDNAMAQGGSTQAIMGTKVDFEGKTYNLSDLASQIATGSANSDGSYNYGAEVAPFWKAYEQLWPAGAMKDPVVSGILDSYVHEIANLSDSNRVVIYKMNNGGSETPSNYREAQANYLNSIGFSSTATLLSQKTGAEITHQDSAAICTTGGNNDSGNHCSG